MPAVFNLHYLIRRFCLIILICFGLCGCSMGGVRAPVEVAQSDYIHTVTFGGETLSLISQWYTGDAANWQKILEHNKGLKAKSLAKGNKIKIPRALVTKETPLPQDFLDKGTKVDSKSKSFQPRVPVKPSVTPGKEILPVPKPLVRPTALPTPQSAQVPRLPTPDLEDFPEKSTEDRAKSREQLLEELLGE